MDTCHAPGRTNGAGGAPWAVGNGDRRKAQQQSCCGRFLNGTGAISALRIASKGPGLSFGKGQASFVAYARTFRPT